MNRSESAERGARIWGAVGLFLIALMVPHLILWVSGVISARIFARVAVAVVAAIHVYFGLLEATQWDRASGLQIHDLGRAVAEQTRPIGQNMGLYNAILATCLVGTFFLGRLDAFRAQAVLLSLIVVAGVFGTLTIGKRKVVAGSFSIGTPKIAAVQAMPAALALAAVLLGRPGTSSEQDATRKIIEVERELLDRKTGARAARKETLVLRGQHPKSVGFVVADFVVREDLPPHLKYGVFRPTKPRLDAVVRFSNARVMDDSESGGHGMSIKLSGVEGDRLIPGSTETDTQDFLLFDNPSFFIRDAFDYADFEAAQLWSADKAGEVNKAKLALAFPNLASLSKLTLQIQKKPPANPLHATYWSVVPYRLGPHAVKFRARPRLQGRSALAGDSASLINDALVSALKSPPEGGWSFDFEVQVQTDPDLMPIEDATVEWKEALSPFVTLATIAIKPAESRERFGEKLGLNDPSASTADEKTRELSEHLSFSPWHGLVEHQPLGGINRVRRPVYEALSAHRHEQNKGSAAGPGPEPEVIGPRRE